MKLGELIEIKHGYAFSGEHIVEDDNGIVLVTPGNFRIGGGFKEEKCKFFDGEIPADYVLKEGDFIVTMTDLSKTIDTLGYSALVPKSKRIYLHNQRIGLVTFKSDECDRGYIYWLMRTREYQRSIANTSTGATVHHTSPKKIYDYDLEVPPLPIQHRIANILSRYDSLIENYQKQIKLLEEAAQRLYKEWFVDLHFPGHENTNIIDGVPEGWEKKSVDSIYNIKYGKNLSTKLITETGFYPVYGANGVIGYYDKANCNEQVVLITSRGNGSGDVLMTYHKDAFITNNSFIVTPSEGFEYCKLPFTFQFLKMANFRAVRTGAAQPQLTNQSIHTVDVILPNKNLIEKFCSATIGMNDTIIKYREQIRLLTEARDRLLPKLMSGELTLEARAEKEDLLATPCKRGWEEDEAK